MHSVMKKRTAESSTLMEEHSYFLYPHHKCSCDEKNEERGLPVQPQPAAVRDEPSATPASLTSSYLVQPGVCIRWDGRNGCNVITHETSDPGFPPAHRIPCHATAFQGVFGQPFRKSPQWLQREQCDYQLELDLYQSRRFQTTRNTSTVEQIIHNVRLKRRLTERQNTLYHGEREILRWHNIACLPLHKRGTRNHCRPHQTRRRYLRRGNSQKTHFALHPLVQASVPNSRVIR